jgi:hypothetical protein
MTKPRRTRNREDASDLVAALVSNYAALHKQAARLSGDVSRLHGRINPCTGSPIGFIAKLKVHTREFAFCGRRIEFVVANRISPDRPGGSNSTLESD